MKYNILLKHYVKDQIFKDIYNLYILTKLYSLFVKYEKIFID